ncbi:ADP-ribose pyrophosphatase, mitochondrial isoform X2 [Leptidea sinapis]|uniref:ADP-ribose pyrophosphatase, mitochondrial isoform X1 n=1 Tax=Leptidea sinapis TaxID=189913 RepID=UPI002135909D|nr:ADP-ribose pyrophosphatase, mitochondrial isoform X1 [Leptidea sinapis]XP_050680066.1 ADP-ribose pyrophosphatase, mitochondrial isoform X2 [Leptidea sinapis]
MNSCFIFLVLMIRIRLSTMTSHYKCRSGVYPRSSVKRLNVSDDRVSWDSEFKDYNPPYYTSDSVKGKSWADPEIDTPNFSPKWNQIERDVNRKSHMGHYNIVNGYPLNPTGRTGLQGRGVLGRWGPNHAADPIVTRWKDVSRDILQFIAIKRGDTGEWALPGGMVNPGEKVLTAAIREFQEEAMNSFEASEADKENWKEKFKDFFSKGIEIYRGYVDDPRNTDNAWMETIAYNFHDETGAVVGNIKLQAGDDAIGVQWVDITPDIILYASHKDIIDSVLNKHQKC